MTARDIEAVKERAVLMDGYVTVDFVDFTTLCAEIEELRDLYDRAIADMASLNDRLDFAVAYATKFIHKVEAAQHPDTLTAITESIASKCQMCVLTGKDLGDHEGDAIAAYNAVIARIEEVTE